MFKYHALIFRFTIALYFVIFSFLLSSCRAASTPEITHTNITSISVVIDDNYPPYSFRDNSGGLQGISIDQWRLWEEKTGVKVNITGMDWSSAQAAMQTGQFDVIDTMFYNDARAQLYDFSTPYATIEVPIYFNNQISGINDAGSVQGFVVAAKSGDAVVDILRENGVENIVLYNNYQSIIQAAAKHEVTVFAIDQPPADYFLNQMNIAADFNSTEPLYSGQFHRAVNKGNDELLTLINSGFENISDGEYDAINHNYFGYPAVDKSLLRYGAYIGIGLVATLLLLLIWNRTLHNIVTKKTNTIQESEKRYRALFEESPISLWVEDPSAAIEYLAELQSKHGGDLRSFLIAHPKEVSKCFALIHVLDVNKATLMLFKAESKEQLLGNLIPVMTGTSIETLADELVEIAKKTPTFSWDGLNTTVDGEPLHVHVRWVVEPGHEEKLDRIILSLVNMTAIKKAEDELRLANERLDLANKAAGLGVWEVDVNTEETIWDARMYELYGQERELFTPSYEGWKQCMTAGSRKDAETIYKKVLKKGGSIETVLHAVHPDGSIHHLKVFGQVVYDEDHHPVKLVGINFDISAIVELEKNRNIISNAHWKITHAESQSEIYKIVAESVHEICPDAIVWVTKVNEAAGDIKVKEVISNPHVEQKLGKKFDFNIKHESFKLIDIPENDLRLFRTGKLEVYPHGLGQLSTWKFPPEACRIIEDEFGYRSIYKIGFVFEDKHLGGLTIVSRDDLHPLAGTIEMIMNLATLALKRIVSEKDLKKSEEQFRSLFAQNPIGIALANIDFRFTAANVAFCRMFGYSEKEISGLSFKELTHPEDLDASRELMQRLADGKINLFSVEKRYIKKDGSIIWGTVTVKAIRDSLGVVVSYLAMLEDITERKYSESMLAEERQKIKVLMDSIPDSVYFKDVENKFTSANLAQIRKFDLKGNSELIGKTDHDFFDEAIAEISDDEEFEIMRTGQPIIGREEIELWPDKPPTWISITKMALYDEAGKVTGTFGVVRDITERKQQEEEIRRLNADLEKKVELRTKELQLKNQELEAFTYTVSHDLKAPLRGISGYADLLLQDHSDQLDEEGKGFISKLIKSSQQLSQLIEDLLTFSRLERRPVSYETVRVSDVIRMLLEQRSKDLESRNFVIHSEIDDEAIRSSLELLTQIIGNYLDNALKFTQMNGKPELWISYKNNGATSLFSIRDNGVGFDMKFKDKIFDVFQRLHTVDVFPGTGIGLALVKKSAELLGYKVWAEGVPDHGATFYLEVVK